MISAWNKICCLLKQHRHSLREIIQRRLHGEPDGTLYVHWPYCAKRCTYCNFNKYVSSSVDHSRMSTCLVTELETLVKLSGIRRLKSIYFGGGTPSLANPITLSNVIEKATGIMYASKDIEITMEVNPTPLETKNLRGFKAAGINRVSVGVQSLEANDLIKLGRVHSVQDAYDCIEVAKELFPGRVSVDVMFGLPGQTQRQWEQQLTELLRICDNHLSLYQLTLERGTQLYKDNTEGRLQIPESDTMADMYQTAVDQLQSSGLRRYEVSNFARKGAESTHNQSYWEGSEYIGIGPGAHGRFFPRKLDQCFREARVQSLEPNVWMREVEKYGHGTRKRIPQSTQDRLGELLMLALRTVKGVSNEKWRHVSGGAGLWDIFGASDSVRSLGESSQLLKLTHERLVATDRGLLVVDSLVPIMLNVIEDWFRPENQGQFKHTL